MRIEHDRSGRPHRELGVDHEFEIRGYRHGLWSHSGHLNLRQDDGVYVIIIANRGSMDGRTRCELRVCSTRCVSTALLQPKQKRGEKLRVSWDDQPMLIPRSKAKDVAE